MARVWQPRPTVGGALTLILPQGRQDAMMMRGEWVKWWLDGPLRHNEIYLRSSDAFSVVIIEVIPSHGMVRFGKCTNQSPP